MTTNCFNNKNIYLYWEIVVISTNSYWPILYPLFAFCPTVLLSQSSSPFVWRPLVYSTHLSHPAFRLYFSSSVIGEMGMGKMVVETCQMVVFGLCMKFCVNELQQQQIHASKPKKSVWRKQKWNVVRVDNVRERSHGVYYHIYIYIVFMVTRAYISLYLCICVQKGQHRKLLII